MRNNTIDRRKILVTRMWHTGRVAMITGECCIAFKSIFPSEDLFLMKIPSHCLNTWDVAQFMRAYFYCWRMLSISKLSHIRITSLFPLHGLFGSVWLFGYSVHGTAKVTNAHTLTRDAIIRLNFESKVWRTLEVSNNNHRIDTLVRRLCRR